MFVVGHGALASSWIGLPPWPLESLWGALPSGLYGSGLLGLYDLIYFVCFLYFLTFVEPLACHALGPRSLFAGWVARPTSPPSQAPISFT